MAKLYGFGAAVVILGALFKIQHYPGAGYMLVAGLGTEALIFFFSAFEPPHQEPDWTLVYPELAGMYDEELKEQLLEDTINARKRGDFQNMGGGSGGGGGGGGNAVSQELDKMLEDANIGPELIESLGNGFRTLSENTQKFAEISNATVATNEYVQNIQGASSKAGELSQTYQKTTQALENDIEVSTKLSESIKTTVSSANNLSDNYQQAANLVKDNINASQEYTNNIKQAATTVNDLKQKYIETGEKLASSVDAINISTDDSAKYNEELNKVSKNLAALNAVYELQLQGSSEQLEKTTSMQENLNKFLSNLKASDENMAKFKDNIASLNQIYEQQATTTSEQMEKSSVLQQGIAQFIENVNSSAENTRKFQEEVSKLTDNISALNNVYGNMLSAMNVNLNPNQ